MNEPTNGRPEGFDPSVGMMNDLNQTNAQLASTHPRRLLHKWLTVSCLGGVNPRIIGHAQSQSAVKQQDLTIDKAEDLLSTNTYREFIAVNYDG